jgi:hypothetical protein
VAKPTRRECISSLAKMPRRSTVELAHYPGRRVGPIPRTAPLSLAVEICNCRSGACHLDDHPAVQKGRVDSIFAIQSGCHVRGDLGDRERWIDHRAAMRVLIRKPAKQKVIDVSVAKTVSDDEKFVGPTKLVAKLE